MDRAQKNFVNSRLIIDACMPYHWRDDFPEINKPGPEFERRAEEKFGWLVK